MIFLWGSGFNNPLLAWPSVAEARYPSHSALQAARTADWCDPRGGFFLGGKRGGCWGPPRHEQSNFTTQSNMIN